MTETAARPQDSNGHTPDLPLAAMPHRRTPFDEHDVPPRPSRQLSYLTWECSVELNYEEFTELMDEAFDLWDRVEAAGTTKVIGDGFDDLIAHIARLREYTGWGGVPGKYLYEQAEH